MFNSARTPFSSSVVFKAAFLRVCEISIQVPEFHAVSLRVITERSGNEVGWGGVAFLFLCFKYIHIYILNNQFLGAKEMCKLPNQGLASPQGQKLEGHLLRWVHVGKAQICRPQAVSTLALNESFRLQQFKPFVQLCTSRSDWTAHGKSWWVGPHPQRFCFN